MKEKTKLLLSVLVCLALIGCKDDPYGTGRIDAESRRIQTGECSIEPDAPNPCLPEGLAVGSVEESPYAAFALALSTLTHRRSLSGFCRAPAKDGELDHLYWTDLGAAQRDCEAKQGRWISFLSLLPPEERGQQ